MTERLALPGPVAPGNAVGLYDPHAPMAMLPPPANEVLTGEIIDRGVPLPGMPNANALPAGVATGGNALAHRDPNTQDVNLDPRLLAGMGFAPLPELGNPFASRKNGGSGMGDISLKEVKIRTHKTTTKDAVAVRNGAYADTLEHPNPERYKDIPHAVKYVGPLAVANAVMSEKLKLRLQGREATGHYRHAVKGRWSLNSATRKAARAKYAELTDPNYVDKD